MPRKKTEVVDIGRFSIDCLIYGVRMQTALEVWELYKKYGSWDLHAFMVKPPVSRETVRKTRKAVELYSED